MKLGKIVLSPKLCPICQTEMRAQRYINEPLDNHFRFVDKDKTSFIYYKCNLPDVKSDNKPYPIHTYSLYTTLYDGDLYQGIYLYDINASIRIFHALYKTEIVYYSAEISSVPGGPATDPDVIVLDNRLLTPDYPKLDKLIEKAKSLAPFL